MEPYSNFVLDTGCDLPQEIPFENIRAFMNTDRGYRNQEALYDHFCPVPSRRLGRSLGINNIPPKVCTYSCVYCQLGRTKKRDSELHCFYDSEEIHNNIAEKVCLANSRGEPIDYCTFVPDRDIHLGREINIVKSFGFKVVVITNASIASLWFIRYGK